MKRSRTPKPLKVNRKRLEKRKNARDGCSGKKRYDIITIKPDLESVALRFGKAAGYVCPKCNCLHITTSLVGPDVVVTAVIDE